MSTAVTEFRWKCTLLLFPDEYYSADMCDQLGQVRKCLITVLNSKNAEINVIVGHKIVYDLKSIDYYSADEQSDTVSINGQPAIEISGPLIDLPYYKSIIIAFIRKVAQELQCPEFSIFFDSLGEKTTSIAPLWLSEISQLQKPDAYYGVISQRTKTITWEFDVGSTAQEFHTQVLSALKFVSERHNMNFCILLQSICSNNRYTLSGGLDFDGENIEHSYHTAVIDFQRYLGVACYPHQDIPDVSSVHFVLHDCISFSK